MGEQAATSLEDRYGGPRRGRRIAVVAACAILATAFLVWLAWAAWLHSDPALSAEVARYEVVSDHEVRVVLQTRVKDGADGSCLVRATARDHTIVGEANLTAARLREVGSSWVPLRTERRATTVDVVRCR